MIAADGPSGHRYLAAYLVAEPGAEIPGVTALRGHLAATLPDYMIPAAWQVLDGLPLTPSGKLDHRALPPAAPGLPGEDNGGAGGESGAASYVPPRTPVEQALALIWADVLGLDRVGIHDNFFDLGGDSILSMQVISRARQRGLSYAAKDLFQHQTIAGLAPCVAGAPDGGPAAREPVTGPVPLTPIQREFLSAGRASPHHFNQSMLVELAPGADEEVLARALDALTVHHDALRTRFEQAGGQWRAAVAPPAPQAPPRQAPPRQAPPRQAPPRQAPPRQAPPRQARPC